MLWDRYEEFNVVLDQFLGQFKWISEGHPQRESKTS
jgi:hypothetical protein